ncbi:cuticle protein 2 [Uranotaenia lowii]|uniref:cuticle protein 2 n=1 Tax=Uranotaenia lowii TaxID=190385 RepID=UPI002478DB89|nr:cuticle protein 2 [Uranotaenia lowii]
MFRFIVVSTLLVAASAQYNQGYNRDPKTAAILSEQRYLSGDGKFGAAYDQEDGTNFKEETDADGTRRGSYSYVDPSGQRRTISYSAGKNGFQASGDHLPVAPAAPPHAAAAEQARYQPQPQYQPQAQYQPQQPQYQPQFSSSGRSLDSQGYDDGQYDPRWNDPAFSEQHSPRKASAPAPAPVHNYHHQPAPAPAPVAPAPQYNNYQHQQAQPAPRQDWATTEAPHRFYPPGKLQLNRTPDGFSYSFNKV